DRQARWKLALCRVGKSPMSTMNLITFLKILLDRLMSRATTSTGGLCHWVAVVLCASVAISVRAVPVVNNNDGYFLDLYQDNVGIGLASQVRIAPPGTVSLIAPNLPGNYRTVEIVPSSF